MRLKYDPKAAVVDQTVLCNQACYFCWRHSKQAVADRTRAAPHKIMPLSMYAKIIKAISEVETVSRLSLSGPMGEPTLVPDLAGRGHIGKALGLTDVIVNTNGFALDKHDPKDMVRGFHKIQVSLDAVDPVIHASIHGKAGQLERILENTEELIAAAKGTACRVMVRFTEGEKNAGHLPEFRRYFEGRARVLYRRVHSFLDTLPDKASEVGARACNQPEGSINFTYTGHLTACCVNHTLEPTFGHIDDGLKAGWESEAFEAWRRERMTGLCKGCSGLGKEAFAQLAERTEG